MPPVVRAARQGKRKIVRLPRVDDGEMTMPVNLSIKNVPEELAERLRRRAASAHRSMQGELMAILEEALEERRPLTPTEVLEKVRALGVQTKREAAGDIRRDREAR